MTAHPKTKNIVDYKYRAWIERQPCAYCGFTKGVVLAHQRMGSDGGTGLKPSDTYGLPLCCECHDIQHRIGETKFWGPLNQYRLMVYYITQYRKETA